MTKCSANGGEENTTQQKEAVGYLVEMGIDLLYLRLLRENKRSQLLSRLRFSRL